jgi:hypothetical protein
MSGWSNQGQHGLGHVARMGEKRKTYEDLEENMKEKDRLKVQNQHKAHTQ